MKYWIFALLLCFEISQARSLQKCINHILHVYGSENLHCQHDEQLHFYSTYVLPDGAYSCLDSMRMKSGFYISTIKTFKILQLSQDQVSQGVLTRPQTVFKGWKCGQDKLVTEQYFKGFTLHLAECKHEQSNFEEICIIKGWPLLQVNDDETL